METFSPIFIGECTELHPQKATEADRKKGALIENRFQAEERGEREAGWDP